MGTHAYILHYLLGGAIPVVDPPPSPPDRLDQPEPGGVGVPHGGAGDHGTARLRCVVDCIGIFERLHLGVDGGDRGAPGGAHTSLVPVLD